MCNGLHIFIDKNYANDVVVSRIPEITLLPFSTDPHRRNPADGRDVLTDRSAIVAFDSMFFK